MRDPLVNPQSDPMRAAADTSSAVPFEPDLAQPRHEELVTVLTGAGSIDIERDLRAQAEKWTLTDLHAHAVFLVFADLVGQGWGFAVHRGVIWATPPLDKPTAGERVEEVKARLRTALQKGRNRQLSEPAVRAFIRRMERVRSVDGKQVSVLNLVDDGHSLSDALRAVDALPPSERSEALACVVDPYLEVATSDAVCAHTGLPLLDIWRYFRHTWSLEYRPTPGRALYVLIRNRARPCAPVMAIAALANAVPQLRGRDHWIGWTVRAYLECADQRPEVWPERIAALLRTLKDARASIRADDLLVEVGNAQAADLERRLRDLASDANQARDAQLAAREELHRDAGDQEARPASVRRLPATATGEVDWAAASETPLFRRKRAETLADLLFAERLLAEAPTDAADFLRTVAVRPDLRKALAIALREVRKVGLASRLLDLNVCGAVAPYRDLLAGKLAGLLVASAEVSAWYRRRYNAHVSEIASQMAGRPVVREPVICALTTTSLYGVAASQYNRLRLTVRDVSGTGIHLHWRDLGVTEGFGTVHLSESTLRALRRVSVAHHGRRHVNNVFGEGTSPRLRQVRDAFAILRLGSQDALKHHTSRRVYGLELFENGLEALATNRPLEGTPRLATAAAIADAWRARWLLPRIANPEVLRRIAQLTPDDVRAELRPHGPAQTSSPPERAAPTVTAPATSRPASLMTTVRPRPELVQSLYRSLSSCADHHDAATLALLHIRTAVDDFVLTEVRAGKVVFVTGNPGDGKTHLLRRLEADLALDGASIVLDANERADDDLLALVDAALAQDRGGCAIAINQGILVDLLRAAGERDWARSARRQLLLPFEYHSSGADSALRKDLGVADDARVRVVDLNLRNNLGPDVIRKALELLVDLSQGCDQCAPGACPGERNGQRLRDSRVVERLVGLLDRVARSGFHATMRDVQGFLSFLIWGGRDCATASSVPISNYWQNAFVGGTGDLFDAVRAFDPVDHPAPLLDDVLWRRADRPEDWFLRYEEDARIASGLLEHRDQFMMRKRRALFEHRRVDALLAATGNAVDQQFVSVVESSRPSAARLVRLLNRFFDRDDERDEELRLWVTHRYDARISRYAATAVSVPSSELEVAVPALPSDLRGAFPDYRPDHALLRRRGEAGGQALRIDRLLLASLVSAEQGLPSTFRRGEPEARIATFYNRLARDAWATHGDVDRLKVRLVDIDTGRNLDLVVDVEQRRFQRY